MPQQPILRLASDSQGLTKSGNESKLLIKSLETQMLATKKEFDLANHKTASKIREIENSCSADHESIVQACKVLDLTVKEARNTCAHPVLMTSIRFLNF